MEYGIIPFIGGPLLMLMGIAILVFRARYAGWWNRAYARRGQSESFTTRGAVFYGLVALVTGAVLLVVFGIR